MAVVFLTARVKKPDGDDWGKLCRCLLYLKDTRHLGLRLSILKTCEIKWWVDTPYNTCKYCKGHTGYYMPVGKGAIISGSNKHKSNARSSTESELVGTDFVLPKTAQCKLSVEAQGYKIKENVLYQDSQATVRLATNRRISGTPRTKHTKAKFYQINR